VKGIAQHIDVGGPQGQPRRLLVIGGRARRSPPARDRPSRKSRLEFTPEMILGFKALDLNGGRSDLVLQQTGLLTVLVSRPWRSLPCRSLPSGKGPRRGEAPRLRGCRSRREQAVEPVAPRPGWRWSGLKCRPGRACSPLPEKGGFPSGAGATASRPGGGVFHPLVRGGSGQGADLELRSGLPRVLRATDPARRSDRGASGRVPSSAVPARRNGDGRRTW
jgi:hypothetical protein